MKWFHTVLKSLYCTIVLVNWWNSCSRMPIAPVSIEYSETDTCKRVAGLQTIFVKADRMVSWSSRYHLISNREELEAYKQLPLAHRDPIISLPPNILTGNDKTTLSSASLKGLWIKGHFATGNDADVCFNAILQSQTLELLVIHLYGIHEVLDYHNVTLRSPISNTLRLLHISTQYLKETGISLLGRSLRFNSVIQEFSVYPGTILDIVYKEYPRLFWYFATSNLRVICHIPMDVVSFFVAAVVLPQSKVDSIWIGKINLLEPKRCWRCLISATCKLQRDVSIKNSNYMNLFSDNERTLLHSLNTREAN